MPKASLRAFGNITIGWLAEPPIDTTSANPDCTTQGRQDMKEDE
jgi:hypothetical protein